MLVILLLRRKIPGARWLASLAKFVSSRFDERHCLKKKKWKMTDCGRHLVLTFDLHKHLYTHVHTHGLTCTHTHAHSCVRTCACVHTYGQMRISIPVITC